MTETGPTVALMKKLLATKAPIIEIMNFCILFETIVIFRLPKPGRRTIQRSCQGDCRRRAK